MMWPMLAAVVLGLLAFGLWCAWTATRLDRLHLQADAARSGLLEATLRRSSEATDLALSGALDPASALALADAAAAARTPDVDDWQPESDLTAVLRLVLADAGDVDTAALTRACREVSMARRIHNDVAVRAQDLRTRRRVRWFHLAGHAPPPRTIEFDTQTD